MKLNPIALVEVIFSFVKFYTDVILDDFESKPSSFSVGVYLRSMHLGGIKTKLGPYGLQSFGQRLSFDLKEAPSNDWSVTQELKTENCDPSWIAFILLREIYLWFGLEENKIPYTKLENGVRVVDPEQIKKPKQ